MRHGVLLAMLGLAQIGLSWEAPAIAWLLCWSGLSWILAGSAYMGLGTRVFGKKADGTMALGNVLLLLPFLVLTWLLWQAQKRMTREPHCNEIAPGLWLGRRCSARELPPDVRMVVDLTAEFGEAAGVRQDRVYICLPVLDASVPELGAFQSLIPTLSDFDGPIYVHCALGHGRSATVIAGLLIARGLAESVDHAEQVVKRARPGIRLHGSQRQLLERWHHDRPPARSARTPPA